MISNADAASRGMQIVEEVEPDPAKLSQAREVVDRLLRIMGVTRVISVDDDYEGTLESLVAMADYAVGQAGGELSDFAGEFNLSGQREFWIDEMTERWDGAADPDRRIMLSRARKQSGKSDDEHQPDAGTVRDLIPTSSVGFLALTPGEWEVDAERILQECTTSPTLFLFDREMRGRPVNEGVKFAGQVFAAASTTSMVHVALLTRTVRKEVEELALWQELSDQSTAIQRDRFLVISKHRLGPDPSTFPQAIKRVLLTSPVAALVSELKVALTSAVNEAVTKVGNLSALDFESLVFAGARSEGLWEPEALLRVYQIFSRSSLRRAIYQSTSIRHNASEIRRLGFADSSAPSDTAEAVRVFVAEVYDSSDEINSVHLPIELGDVFEVGPERLPYVLVAQPCDLMVRERGVRAPELADVALLPVRRDAPSRIEVGFKLPYFFPDGHGWVWLNRFVPVPAVVLDLTVLNKAGLSEIAEGAEPHHELWPVWQQRQAVLLKHHGLAVNRLQTVLTNLNQGVDNTVRSLMMDQFLRADKARGYKAKGTLKSEGGIWQLKYDVQRVRRVHQLRARALLGAYSLHSSRDAFDFDLVRDGDR